MTLKRTLSWLAVVASVPLVIGAGPATATATDATGGLTVAGVLLDGATVPPTFTVAAPDLAGTVKAKLRLDGAYVATDTTVPFSFPVSTAAGRHSLEVRLYDAAGTETRLGATFTAGTASSGAPAPSPVPAPPPAVTPASGVPALTVEGRPLDGGVLGTALTVTAPDLGGTVKAKFRIDGTYLGTDVTLPYAWPLEIAAGSHEVDVRLYDENGEQGRLSARFTSRTDATAPTAAPAPAPQPVPAPAHAPQPAPGTGGAVTVRDGAGLAAALAAARPGTTITLADGVYTAKQQFTVKTACTAAEPCVLRGGRGAVLDGTGVGGHYGLHLTGADHWTVAGLSVRNASKGIVLDRSDHTVIDGVEVSQIGAEGIHLRAFSSDGVVRHSLVHHVGVTKPQYGEGIYIGSAVSNWGTYSGGLPDRSDRNVITGNRIWATGAESVDIKEGTTGGVLSGNTFDGAGMAGKNSADSWVDVKGNEWLISGNTGTNALLDGFQTHVLSPGWGQRNLFTGNTATVNSAGYGIRIHNPATTANVIRCDNTITAAALGTANQACR